MFDVLMVIAHRLTFRGGGGDCVCLCRGCWRGALMRRAIVSILNDWQFVMWTKRQDGRRADRIWSMGAKWLEDVVWVLVAVVCLRFWVDKQLFCLSQRVFSGGWAKYSSSKYYVHFADIKMQL